MDLSLGDLLGADRGGGENGEGGGGGDGERQWG